MPCNLGYRSVARARVEAPAPAPSVDGELLDRLGVEDPVFRDWLLGLDLAPLLAGRGRGLLDVLRVVCELLGYSVTVEGPVLEGEKGGAVPEYVRISVGAGGSEVRFEHFASEGALALEELRLVALAQRLGVRLRLDGWRRAGQPIPAGAVHLHGVKKVTS